MVVKAANDQELHQEETSKKISKPINSNKSLSKLSKWLKGK